MFLCPGFDGEHGLAGGEIAPPGSRDVGEVLERKIVEVGQEAVDFFFWGFCGVGGVGFYVKFRGVYWFGSGVNQYVEGKS